jgi:hypothetical protein
MSGMIINTAKELHDECRRLAESHIRELGEAAAAHAVECIASVIWRNAFGQGLKLGDDWGWILDVYDAAAVADIVQAAAGSLAADDRRRSRQGF